LGKDLEEEHRVGNIGEFLIGAKGSTEVTPAGPDVIVCAGAQRNNAGIKCCPQQAEIRADFITVLSRDKRQGSVWG
jgi:hypothetical protein